MIFEIREMSRESNITPDSFEQLSYIKKQRLFLELFSPTNSHRSATGHPIPADTSAEPAGAASRAATNSPRSATAPTIPAGTSAQQARGPPNPASSPSQPATAPSTPADTSDRQARGSPNAASSPSQPATKHQFAAIGSSASSFSYCGRCRR